MAIEFGKKELPPLPSEREIEDLFAVLKNRLEDERYFKNEYFEKGFTVAAIMTEDILKAEKAGALDEALQDYSRYMLCAPSDFHGGFMEALGKVQEETANAKESSVAKTVYAYLRGFETIMGRESKKLEELGVGPRDKGHLFAFYDLINRYMMLEGALPPEEAAQVIKAEAKKLFPKISVGDLNRYIEIDDRLKFYLRPDPDLKSGSPTRMHKSVLPKEAEEFEEKQVSLLRKPANYQIRWKEMPAEEVAKILDWEIQQEYKALAQKEKSGNQ